MGSPCDHLRLARGGGGREGGGNATPTDTDLPPAVTQAAAAGTLPRLDGGGGGNRGGANPTATGNRGGIKLTAEGIVQGMVIWITLFDFFPVT